MSNKSGLGDVLLAFHNANCTNFNLFKSVIDTMWKDKALVMSQDWYDNKLPKVIKDDASLIKTMNATAAGTNGFAKNKQNFFDTKYANMISSPAKPTRKTKTATRTTSSTSTSTSNTANTTSNTVVHHTAPGKISLRTVLTYYGNEQIFDADVVLPQIQRMENDGVITSGSYSFISSGPGKTTPMLESTIKKCLQGLSWQNQPLQDFKNFAEYIPAEYRPTYIKNHSTTHDTNNVRTVIAALYKKGKCRDALKVAGVLSDLKAAGFVNMNYNLIPGLVNMTEDELQKLGESAVKGTGVFKNQKLIKDKELLEIL